jgi:cell division protein FtsW (lipid II flippase)
LSKRQPNIDWSYSGAPDPLTGNGSTLIEQLLFWFAGIAGAALMFLFYFQGWIAWSWWEAVLSALIAFDLIGGAATASLNSSKRWYFTPPKPDEKGALRLLKSGYYLPAIHVHPMLVYMLFRPTDFGTGIAIYFIVGSAAILVRAAPLYLARPLAIVCVLAAVLANAYLLRAPAGFEWMLPALVLKLVLGYGVREEPYRPTT